MNATVALLEKLNAFTASICCCAGLEASTTVWCNGGQGKETRETRQEQRRVEGLKQIWWTYNLPVTQLNTAIGSVKFCTMMRHSEMEHVFRPLVQKGAAFQYEKRSN